MIARGKISNPKFNSQHIKPHKTKKAVQLPHVKSHRTTHKRPFKPCPKGNDVCHCHTL